jgi:glycosyltransferase involved in cell wall biosynthesis
MIHEGIGDYNAIAKITMAGVEAALSAGWEVFCVAKRLDEGLQQKVTWLELHVPARVFLYKWLTARHYISAAMGNRKFDVIHTNQPQVADLCDVFQCHYLTHFAFPFNFEPGHINLRGRIMQAQEWGTLLAENYFFNRWNPKTEILYDSELTQRDFERQYGRPPLGQVLHCPMPRVSIPSPDERRAARESYFGSDISRPVVGFLGGALWRKGYPRLIDAASRETDLLFLVGGSNSESLPVPPEAAEHVLKIGLVTDLNRFYAACDVLLVPSFYESLGLVAFEAAARGIPIIATKEVGALPYIHQHRMGSLWTPGTPLKPHVDLLLADSRAHQSTAFEMEAELGIEAYSHRLIEIYQAVLSRKSAREPQPTEVLAGL